MPLRRSLVSIASLLLAAHVAVAESLTFQEGDGGAYSGTNATTLSALNAGTSAIVTVVTVDVQALIRFSNIIGGNPGQIPPGSTIDSASLTVTTSHAPNEISWNNIHEVYVAWDENTVTSASFYALAGSHYGPLAGVIPREGPGLPATGDVTAVVQHWADGAANHGVMLRKEESAAPEEGFYITQYYSDDATTIAWRPKLTVEFTPPLVGVESTTWGKVKALYR
jgi:hypothetical protein